MPTGVKYEIQESDLGLDLGISLRILATPKRFGEEITEEIPTRNPGGFALLTSGGFPRVSSGKTALGTPEGLLE